MSKRVFPIVIGAGFLAFLSPCGCQKSGTSPTEQSLSIQGDLEVEDSDAPYQATLQLYAAPQEPELQQAIADYPSLGFAPLAPLLFNPRAQSPLAQATPDAEGNFRFDNLSPGNYILDAELEGYGCAEPKFLILPDDASAGTLRLSPLEPISGNLQDATWASGSAYLLTGNALVLPQATLTIESGVLILIAGDYALTVDGKIQANGAPSDPIRFRLTEEHFQAGGDWGGLRLDQAAGVCTITGTAIQGASTALRVIGGTAQVSECLFVAPHAFAAYFSAAAIGGVNHSIVQDGDQGLVADNCNPLFELNLILRTAGPGITVKTNSQAILHANALLDCQTGVWSDWNTAPLIHYNLISGGARGLDAQDGFSAIVQYNEFRDQTEECIYLHVRNCYPQLENNNFVAAPQIILHVNGNAGGQADTVFAPHNYWDGEDATGIPNRILDGHDLGSPDNPIGPVDYMPFRDDPVPEAGP